MTKNKTTWFSMAQPIKSIHLHQVTCTQFTEIQMGPWFLGISMPKVLVSFMMGVRQPPLNNVVVGGNLHAWVVLNTERFLYQGSNGSWKKKNLEWFWLEWFWWNFEMRTGMKRYGSPRIWCNVTEHNAPAFTSALSHSSQASGSSAFCGGKGKGSHHQLVWSVYVF